MRNQSIGEVKNSTDGKFFPHSGIVGLAGNRFAADNTTPFLHALCSLGLVEECRFGLALGSAGTGNLIMGKLDNSLFKGNLTTAPILEEWFLKSDIIFKGETFSADAVVELDSGSATVTGYILNRSEPPNSLTLISQAYSGRIRHLQPDRPSKYHEEHLGRRDTDCLCPMRLLAA